MLHDIAINLALLSVALIASLAKTTAVFYENLSFHSIRGGLTAAHFNFSQESEQFTSLDLTRNLPLGD